MLKLLLNIDRMTPTILIHSPLQILTVKYIKNSNSITVMGLLSLNILDANMWNSLRDGSDQLRFLDHHKNVRKHVAKYYRTAYITYLHLLRQCESVSPLSLFTSGWLSPRGVLGTSWKIVITCLAIVYVLYLFTM